MTIARALVVDVAMNVARIQKDVSRSTREFSRMKKSIGGIQSAARTAGRALVAFGGIAGIGYAVKSSIEAADAIGKAADTVALSTDTYQELAETFKRAGVEQSQFTSNMTAFIKRVGEARANTGPLVSFLNKYDKSLLSSIQNTKSQEEALYLISNAIKNASKETDKAALANAAFSRAGVQMVIGLKDGAAGLDESRARVKALGTVIDESAVRAAERANDRLDEMSTTLSTKFNSAIAGNAEGLTKFAEAMIRVINATGEATSTVVSFTKWMSEDLASAIYGIADDDLVRLNDRLATVNESLATIQRLGLKHNTKGELEAEKKSLEERIAGAERMMQVNNDVAASEERIATLRSQSSAETGGGELQAMQDRLDSLREGLKTKEELEAEAHMVSLDLLKSSLENKLITIQEYNSYETALTEQHQNSLAKTESKWAAFRLAYEKRSAQGKVQLLLESAEAISQKTKLTGKSLIAIGKKLAIDELKVHGAAAVGKSVAAAGGLPWGAWAGAMTALKYIALMGVVNAIPGGGGGGGGAALSGGGGSGSGAAPSAPATTTAAEQPQTQAAKTLPSQNIVVNVQNGMGNTEYWQDLVDNVIVPGINDAQDRNVNLTLRNA